MPRLAEREWRRQKIRSAIAIGSVIAAVAIIVVITNDGHGPDVANFSACVSHRPFLTTTVRRSNGFVIDTIRDRASGVVVGEFAMLPTSRRAAATFTSTIGPASGGSGSANGRFLLYTRSPDGRDTQAMFTCSEPEIPGP